MPAGTARAVSPIQDQLLRISRAPATKTTVVTTTTTTTVSFPPFVIRKPRLARRDLRLFPLADKPVPSAIRGVVVVDVDGEAAMFEEASDPEAALNQVLPLGLLVVF
jgi:F-box and WD-40 domain protein CDC4